MLSVVEKSSKLRGIRLEEFKSEALYLPGAAPANETEAENVFNQASPALPQEYAIELDSEKIKHNPI